MPPPSRRIHPPSLSAVGAACPAGPLGPDPGLHPAHRPGTRHGGAPCPGCCPLPPRPQRPHGQRHQMMSWITCRIWCGPCCFSSSTAGCDGIFSGTARNRSAIAGSSETLAATLHRPHLFFVPAPPATPDGRAAGSAAHRTAHAARPLAAGRFSLQLPACPALWTICCTHPVDPMSTSRPRSGCVQPSEQPCPSP